MSAIATDVSSESAERVAMGPDLELIADVRGGLSKMREKSSVYLPKYAAEDRDEYARRVAASVWRPVFRDCLETLSSKPFSKAVSLPAGTPASILKFAEDVDCAGNNLHVFARRWFAAALADGVAMALVDYPKAHGVRTLADEKRLGLRPRWSLYPANTIIALRTELIKGRREIVHARLRETIIEPDGDFGERQVQQIRVLYPGRWEVWRRDEKRRGEWTLHDGGPTENRAGTPQNGVDAVLLFTGERQGDILCQPPLLSLAHANVELYRAMSLQTECMIYSGSPMLCGAGVAPPENGTIETGPKRVLFSPPTGDGRSGSWHYIQPNAENLRAIAEHVASIISDAQRLSFAPLVARPGIATATQSILDASRAHSALGAWSLGLADALEETLRRTIPWLSYDDRRAVGNWAPSVDVFHDFGSDQAVATEAGLILEAERERIISKRSARDELVRRGVLAPNFDPKADDARLAAEAPAAKKGRAAQR